MPTAKKSSSRTAPASKAGATAPAAKRSPPAKSAAAKSPAAKRPAARKPADAGAAVQFRWFIADEVRQQEGKLSLVGLYPDNVILARVPEGAPEPSHAHPLQIPGLSMLCNVSGLASEQSFTLVLDDSELGEFAAGPQAGGSCNLVFHFPAIEVRSWGVNTVALRSRDGKLQGVATFELRRAPG